MGSAEGAGGGLLGTGMSDGIVCLDVDVEPEAVVAVLPVVVVVVAAARAESNEDKAAGQLENDLLQVDWIHCDATRLIDRLNLDDMVQASKTGRKEKRKTLKLGAGRVEYSLPATHQSKQLVHYLTRARILNLNTSPPLALPVMSSGALQGAATPSYTIELDANKYDAEQIHLMEERLILLSPDDQAIGEGSKKDCKEKQLERALYTTELTMNSARARGHRQVT